MKNRQNGFTLIELLVVVGVLAVMTLIALPQFSEWRKRAQYREAAREIASVFRGVRSAAIARNTENQVIISITAGTLTVSPATSLSIQLSDGIRLNSGDACDQDDDVNISFYPNGTFLAAPDTTPTICVMGTDGSQRFTVSMESPLSGRVVID